MRIIKAKSVYRPEDGIEYETWEAKEANYLIILTSMHPEPDVRNVRVLHMPTRQLVQSRRIIPSFYTYDMAAVPAIMNDVLFQMRHAPTAWKPNQVCDVLQQLAHFYVSELGPSTPESCAFIRNAKNELAYVKETYDNMIVRWYNQPEGVVNADNVVRDPKNRVYDHVKLEMRHVSHRFSRNKRLVPLLEKVDPF